MDRIFQWVWDRYAQAATITCGATLDEFPDHHGSL